jgi:hypothetical protein
MAEAPGGLDGARSVVSWATEAGLPVASVEEIAETIDRTGVFSQDILAELLVRIGVDPDGH